MSKKDFIAIARELKRGRDYLISEAITQKKDGSLSLAAYNYAINMTINGISQVAPTFDRQIFWKFIKGEQ